MGIVGQLHYRLLLRRRPKRYADLFRIIYQNRCHRIVEVGTWNGQHAKQMIQVAALHHPLQKIHYYGFDLFEDLSHEDFEREFSKRPPAAQEVRRRLEQTGAHIHLYRGNTITTLPAAREDLRGADFIFIDGGHSPETVASDWKNLSQVLTPDTTVVLDDYYHNTEPEVRELGCRTLVDSLDRDAYEVEVLEPMDAFPKEWGILRISMARVKLIAEKGDRPQRSALLPNS